MQGTTTNNTQSQRTLVFDIEGDGLYETITKVWCIVAEDVDTGEVRKFGPDELSAACDYLNTASTIVGHNIIDFDLPVLSSLLGFVPSSSTDIVDTLVLSRLLNPDREIPSGCRGPHGLDAWGVRNHVPKPKHEDWSQYSEEMLHRCTQDVRNNVITYRKLLREMEGHDWSDAIRIEHRVAEIISNQSKAGVFFNTSSAKDCIQELSERIQRIDDKLAPILPVTWKQFGVPVAKPFLKTGKPSKAASDWLDKQVDYLSGPFTRVYYEEFNLNSDKQVKDLLFSHGWEPVEWNYDDYGQRTSPKLKFSDDGDDGIDTELGKLLKERKLWCHRRSQIQGWVDSVRPDGTISASANPCGTNTGRMRHSGVVNVPKAASYVPFGKEMRSLFTARPGRTLIGYDATGLELRMLAHYMNDPDYTEVLLNGDIHTYNQELAGLPTRDAAKTFIYAFNYGAGDAKLGSIVGGSADEGKALRVRFLSENKALDKLIRGVKRASGRGYLLGLDGRMLHMRRGSDGRIQRNKALNTLLQGGGAIVMKQAMIYLDDWVKEHKLDAIKVIDMHDEAQWDVNPKDVEKFKELAELSVVKAGEYFNLNVPLAADVKVGNNWAETH